MTNPRYESKGALYKYAQPVKFDEYDRYGASEDDDPYDEVDDLMDSGDGALAFVPAPVVHQTKNFRSAFNSVVPGAGGAEKNKLRPLQHGHGEARKPDASGVVPRKAPGVRYLDHAKRKKYEVTIGQSIAYTMDGRQLDTPSVRKHYEASRKDIGAANWGSPLTTNSKGGVGKSGLFKPLDGWRGALIWVCVEGENGIPRFYSHVCKIGVFHHSSFNSGGAVMGAGEWLVEGGKLRLVSANSGHYRPNMSIFVRALRYMTEAFQVDTQVALYDKQDDGWVHLPVREFLNNPKTGRYFVHPQAVK
ncbi:MAG TPA: hypothetical protein VFV33_06075 [Gemmatimonadaceae bacterium]|nr:hypothetical protein [Gemmatimonadaceae bacterium]